MCIRDRVSSIFCVMMGLRRFWAKAVVVIASAASRASPVNRAGKMRSGDLRIGDLRIMDVSPRVIEMGWARRIFAEEQRRGASFRGSAHASANVGRMLSHPTFADNLRRYVDL